MNTNGNFGGGGWGNNEDKRHWRSRKKNPVRGEAQSVGDAIREMLNSYRLNAKFDEQSVVNSWARLVGGPIARRTKKVYIKNKILFVEFDSPAMRHDFSLHRTHILEVFKKEFGPGVVEEIVGM